MHSNLFADVFPHDTEREAKCINVSEGHQERDSARTLNLGARAPVNKNTLILTTFFDKFRLYPQTSLQ